MDEENYTKKDFYKDKKRALIIFGTTLVIGISSLLGFGISKKNIESYLDNNPLEKKEIVQKLEDKRDLYNGIHKGAYVVSALSMILGYLVAQGKYVPINDQRNKSEVIKHQQK